MLEGWLVALCDGCNSGPSKTSKGQGGRVPHSSQPALIDYCDASLSKKKERKKKKATQQICGWKSGLWEVGGEENRQFNQAGSLSVLNLLY